MKNSESTPRMKKMKGGGKLSRSEMVSVRLSPQLRYLAELAARQQRRTLSSFIEWALERQVAESEIYEGHYQCDNNRKFIGDVALNIWDVDEVDRFHILVARFPLLLTHDEQVLWKTIQSCAWLWGESDIEPHKRTPLQQMKILRVDRLKQIWPLIKEVAAGARDFDELPCGE